MNRIIEILKSIRPDVDFETEENLIDKGILDSMDIVQLVHELSEEYEVRIRARDMIPENFNSAAAICSLIERLSGE